MSRCEYCPSLFHSSSQCKLKPKVLSRTPSEEIREISGNKNRVEDYLVFSDRVNETNMKKLVSPFSFSLESLADKGATTDNQFYIDKGGERSTNLESPNQPSKANETDSAKDSWGNASGSPKDSWANASGSPKDSWANASDNRNGSIGTDNNQSEQSPRSFTAQRNTDSYHQRNYNWRNGENNRSNPTKTYHRNDNFKSGNSSYNGYSRDSRNDNRNRNNSYGKYPKVSGANGRYGDRFDNSRSVNDLSFTIQNDHGQGGDAFSTRRERFSEPLKPNEKNDYIPKGIPIPVPESEPINPIATISSATGNENQPRNLNKNQSISQENGCPNGTTRTVSRESQEPIRVSNDRSQDVVVISKKSIGTKRLFRTDEEETAKDSSTSMTSDLLHRVKIANSERSSPSKKTLNGSRTVSFGSAQTAAADVPRNKTFSPRLVKVTPSQVVEISLENNLSQNVPIPIDIIMDDESASTTPSKAVLKKSVTKRPDKEKSDIVDLDWKKISYHHMKFETKRRNAYAELDASISLEILKMNSTISELEVFLFENAPDLIDESSGSLNRLKNQKDCFKQLKDTYLKQFSEIEDEESKFFSDKAKLVGNQRKKSTHDASLGSSNESSPEKQPSTISLNSSPVSKKDHINQEYNPSIIGESNEFFPANPRNDSHVYSSSNGLVSISSILDGKPRSLLFSNSNSAESLDGILFSTTLENKFQVWDIPSFSPIKSISFNGEREKSEKITLPEDMCWVSPNSILISSKSTEKVKDQEWNNLSLLYDLRRSIKPGGFKYKVLNFKEHGHGAISVIKGISNTSRNMTRWITGGYNNKVYIWSIGDLSADTTLDSKLLMDEHTSTVTALHYCNYRNLIYSGGFDGKVFAYNVDGTVQSSFSMKPKKIRDICQIGSKPSDLLIATSDRESEFLIYDALNNAPVMQFGSRKQLTTADDKIERVRTMYQHSAVHPNGYLVCMGDHNTSKINMWDIRKPTIPLQFDVHDKGQTDRGKSKYHSLVLGFHNEGEKQFLYSLGSDKRIVRIDLGSVF